MAIDVFKHASLNNISEAHIMTKDLDFFPLFEALRDTPVSVHLHCDTDETTEELMSLADVVVPITPFTIMRWLRQSNASEKYVERNIQFDNLPVGGVVKEGTFDGQPFRIYKVERENVPPTFAGHSMAHHAQRVICSEKWEYIVADFEDRRRQRI